MEKSFITYNRYTIFGNSIQNVLHESGKLITINYMQVDQVLRVWQFNIRLILQESTLFLDAVDKRKLVLYFPATVEKAVSNYKNIVNYVSVLDC